MEEIFASVSSVQASGLNPPPARTVLTPRSAEACLKHGINPEILRIRDLESFYDASVDPAIQRMRHEAYSQRRHEMMGLVRGERKKIVNAEMKASQGKGGGSTEGLTPGAMMAAQAKANANFVEMEEKRMLKMKKRQEKEVQQMLEFEMKMTGIAEERARRAELEKQKVGRVLRGSHARRRPSQPQRHTESVARGVWQCAALPSDRRNRSARAWPFATVPRRFPPLPNSTGSRPAETVRTHASRATRPEPRIPWEAKAFQRRGPLALRPSRLLSARGDPFLFPAVAASPPPPPPPPRARLLHLHFLLLPALPWCARPRRFRRTGGSGIR